MRSCSAPCRPIGGRRLAPGRRSGRWRSTPGRSRCPRVRPTGWELGRSAARQPVRLLDAPAERRLGRVALFGGPGKACAVVASTRKSSKPLDFHTATLRTAVEAGPHYAGIRRAHETFRATAALPGPPPRRLDGPMKRTDLFLTIRASRPGWRAGWTRFSPCRFTCRKRCGAGDPAPLARLIHGTSRRDNFRDGSGTLPSARVPFFWRRCFPSARQLQTRPW